MNKPNHDQERVKIQTTYTVPPKTTKTIIAQIDVREQFPMTGTIDPMPPFSEDHRLLVANSVSTAQNRQIPIRITNQGENPYTLKEGTHIANFTIPSPEQAKSLRPIDTATLNLLQTETGDQTNIYINELLKVSNDPQDNFWFPTPQNPGNTETHTEIQKRILEEQYKLIELEQLDPKRDDTSRRQFLDKFQWNDSLLNIEQKESLESILVDFPRHLRETSARHRHQQRIQSQTHTKRRQTHIQPELADANQPQRRFHSRTSTDAQIRNHHSSTILKVRESHLCTT